MLKKILVALFLAFKVSSVFASDNIADSSAKINPNVRPLDKEGFKTATLEANKKRYVIAKVLEKYQSPLLGSVDAFVNTCKEYKFNCYLLPSISGLESRFGWYTAPGSHNPFGWGGGYIMFENWDKAIATVGEGLAKNYIGRGAVTVDEIGPIYAESPTWAIRVNSFIREFEAEEEKLALTLDTAELQL